MHRSLRLFSTTSGTLAVLAAAAVAVPAQAAAGRAQAPAGLARAGTAARPAGSPVGVTPAAGTPHFPVTTTPVEQIRQLVQCGGVMYAVGSFSVVDQGAQTFHRTNAFSFSATAPFKMTTWHPFINGVVNSITFNSGNCSRAYIGGRFSKINTTNVGDIAEISTSGIGTVVSAFKHSANGQVETLASYQNHILAGGYFTAISDSRGSPYLASLNATSGAVDGLLRLRISGNVQHPGVAPNPTRVFNQQVSHSGRLDLVEGDFTSAGGKHRRQIFMLNLASRPHATVTGWTSPRFDGSLGYPPHGYFYDCSDTEPFYIKSAAWSPDDHTIYLASTGTRPWNMKTRVPLRGMCDMAAAFTATFTSPKLKWINYTGCDSLYSVAADKSDAFFGGHQRWSQNPGGCNKMGPGAVVDPGLEGLNAATGAVLLNTSGQGLYSRARGLGADDMLFTKAGLWIASDNFAGADSCDGVTGLAGLCFLPFGP